MPEQPDFVYLPSRAIRVANAEFARRAGAEGIAWDIRSMDKALVPMVAGDLVSLLGRPGMGKTSLLLHLIRSAAATVKKTGECVVYATWETLVEEFVGALASGASGYTLEDIGRGIADLDRVQDASMRLLQSGIVVFGRSMESPPGKVPDLQDLAAALAHLRNERGMNPRLVIVDYLQRLPALRGRERSESVSENLEQAKDLALGSRVPLVLAVQARREVDDQGGLRMPGMRDAQWSSNVEQTSDKVLAVTKPASYLSAGSVIRKDGLEYVVNERMLCVKVLKQRWGPVTESVLMLDFDPKTYVMRPMAVTGEAESEVY